MCKNCNKCFNEYVLICLLSQIVTTLILSGWIHVHSIQYSLINKARSCVNINAVCMVNGLSFCL